MQATIFEKKRIILGVTGSIAAYKVADLASKLTQSGVLVDVILTESAQQFITPLTFQALTGRPVYTDMWRAPESGSALPTHIAHVGLGEGADLIIIAPATANTLAKLAAGLADDLLSVTLLAARSPVMIAPAMDGGMYEHPATQANLERLRGFGYHIIEPEQGRFASGLEGRGRLPETTTLLGHTRRVLGLHNGALTGKKILVTAGGTREAIDPVRFISNHSSGKQGYAIAQAAIDAGADVTLISTISPEALPVPIGAEFIQVASAAEMQEAVLAHNQCDALVMAGAVADFRPAEVAEQKIKKESAAPQIVLARNDDILATLGANRKASGWPKLCIGFAAETQDLIANAQGKLERKNLDFIVANDLTQAGAGFAGDTNAVTIIGRGGFTENLPLMSKAAVAEHIMRLIAKHAKAQH